MPATLKQESRARKSREAKMLSELKNRDIMLDSNHFERKDSEFRNSAIRPKIPNYDAFLDCNTKCRTNSSENEIRLFAGICHNSAEIGSSSKINRLSGELNQRITLEMNRLMNIVSLQTQMAIREAIIEHALPQIQASLKSGSGQMPPKGWNFPTKRPEYRSEGKLNRRIRSM